MLMLIMMMLPPPGPAGPGKLTDSAWNNSGSRRAVNVRNTS